MQIYINLISSNFRVPICLTLSVPCLYIWLNILSPVDTIYSVAYRFSCFAIAFSCIIEMTAEAPVFIGQVFCFVKVKVILDTLHVFLRSIVFILLVINNKDIAIYAFGIAQLFSALTVILGNYIFFHIYIKKLNAYRKLQTNPNETNSNLIKLNVKAVNPSFDNMDDFPFNSVNEFFPGVLKNTVSVTISFCYI